MNYYEELGIAPDAPVEEVRQAYKLMARLLHPDAQVDPKLKALAECQMKRLGDIAAVLVSPERRRQYDASLLTGNELQVHDRGWASRSAAVLTWKGNDTLAQLAVRYWFWILIAMAVLGLGVWNLTQREPSNEAAAPTNATPPVEIAPERRESKEAGTAPLRNRGERRPDLSEISPAVKADAAPVEPLAAEPAKADPGPPTGVVHAAKPSSPAAPLRQESEARSVEVPRTSAPNHASSFAGRWLYSPEAGDPKDKGQYPAIYVEFVLGGDDGALAGDYRARYRIPDRAVSPEVEFQVRGVATEKGASLEWTSRNGAKGKAELTLRTRDVMQVTWWTTAFGKQATLASGTAVLIRQRAP